MKKLFGKKSLLEVIDSNNIINVDISPNNKELIKLLESKSIKYVIRNKHYFINHFSDSLNHQGVVINIKDSQQIDSLDDLINENCDKAIILIVDSINDPQNFGAIIRTCAAFNVKAIIYKEHGQVQITDFVTKSSMGGISKVNMIQVTNLSNTIDLLKKAGYWIYASTLSNKSQDYSNIKFDKKTVLIVGNENNGVSKLLLEHSDFLIKIPMSVNIQSLNVSVATGIILAKIFEQNK